MEFEFLFLAERFFEYELWFSWHQLLCHSLVRSIFMGSGPHPPSPSPLGEGAALYIFNELLILPHQLLISNLQLSASLHFYQSF